MDFIDWLDKEKIKKEYGDVLVIQKKCFDENYISKDKVREVIKKYYDDYEKQKRYRYTPDVEEEQSVLKDIEKELLGVNNE